MATWSSYRAPINNIPDQDYPVLSDGEYVYWVHTTGSFQNIIQYDPVGDTETTIYFNDGISGLSEMYSYTIFKGDVYAIGQETGTFDYSTFRYGGTPDDWVFVDKLQAGATAGAYAVIFANDDYIAAVHVDFNVAYTTVGHHSTDGISWSVSSFETTPIQGNGGYSLLFSTMMNRSRPFINAFCVTKSGSNCTSSNLMEFDGSSWSDVITGISDNSEVAAIVSPIFNQCWTWLQDPTSTLYAQRQNDTFDSPDTPDVNIQPIATTNYGRQFGVSTGTVSSQIYIWNSSSDSDWTPLDTVSDGILMTPSEFTSMPVMDDLEAYLLFFNLDNGQYEIWKRDEPLPPIGGTLYFGQGILEEKAILPFVACLPQAFALQQSLGILVLGADRPTGDMVVYSEHPYDAVTIMDENIPTGTSVSAIKWV